MRFATPSTRSRKFRSIDRTEMTVGSVLSDEKESLRALPSSVCNAADAVAARQIVRDARCREDCNDIGTDLHAAQIGSD